MFKFYIKFGANALATDEVWS